MRKVGPREFKNHCQHIRKNRETSFIQGNNNDNNDNDNNDNNDNIIILVLSTVNPIVMVTYMYT